MRHILLTWNPGPNDNEQWTPEQWHRSMVGGAANGRAPGNRWSVGRRTQGIERGDRGYLYRQGPHGRGLVAIAEITHEPFVADDWRGTGGEASYVGLRWLDCLPLEEMITLDELETHVPAFPWRKVYSSGREVPGMQGEQLYDLWANRVFDVTGLPDALIADAGFGSAAENLRVERAAVNFVREAYIARNYLVKSVERDRCGWDLTVQNADEELHVEVKGVSGPLPRFFLTANEYQQAAQDRLRWRLIVVTNALVQPKSYEVNWPQIRRYSSPVLHRVHVPLDVLT
jgi:hypothetical protein